MKTSDRPGKTPALINYSGGELETDGTTIFVMRSLCSPGTPPEPSRPHIECY